MARLEGGLMGYVIAAVLVFGGVLGRWFFYESARQFGEFLGLWDRGKRR